MNRSHFRSLATAFALRLLCCSYLPQRTVCSCTRSSVLLACTTVLTSGPTLLAHFTSSSSSASTQSITGMSKTRLEDDFTDKGTSEDAAVVFPPQMHHFEEVTSTMDKSREFVKGSKDNLFAVLAERQSQGRGTRGRAWLYGSGNVLMTIAIRRQSLPIPLHLLPLRVGTLIASAIQPYITNPDAVLKLKWPNDILINGQKVCGVLIEMEDDYLLVGIGCNVRTAPSIDSKGADAGRTSTAIALHNPTMLQQQDDIFDAHRRVSLAIYQRFEEWLQSSDSAGRIIADFSSNMDYSIQTLRDASIPIHANQVQPLCLNDDGTLKVRYMHNSEDGTLVADYLF